MYTKDVQMKKEYNLQKYNYIFTKDKILRKQRI